jgi:hypothetical protein
MSARVELESSAQGASQAGTAAALAPAALAPVALDPDVDFGHDLPNDHPPWPRDTVSLSQRARALFATLRPIAIRVVTFWEQRVRAIVVAGQTLTVDASGSYRLD